MGKALKWFGILLGILLGAVLVAYTALYVITENRLNQVYDFGPSGLEIPNNDEEGIARGQHIVATFGFCTECHGENLAGAIMEDDPLVARLIAPNLTSGRGGIASRFTDDDWVRAIRHGIGQDGKALIVMPSDLFSKIGDNDLAALIAYLKSVPPVDNELAPLTVGPMGRFFLLQDPALLPVQVIDHASRPSNPPPARTIEYGRYLTSFCVVCHGENLAGSPEFGGGLNLTPAGDLLNWSEADFIRALRTGVTPEGKELDPELMPWKSVGRLTDEELGAIWLYLQTVPPVEDVQP